MKSYVAFPEVAGGFCDDAVAVNDVVQTVKGCKVTHAATGIWQVIPHQPIPIGRLRVWAQTIGPTTPTEISVVHGNPLLFTIYTSQVVGDGDGGVALQAADMDFCFGVSVIPD